MKRTTDWRWAHLSCALNTTEAFFGLPEGREPIDLTHIPQDRFTMECYLCCARGDGACMQCVEKGCFKAFHVSCAHAYGLEIDFFET
jgi:hypothetical protein